MRARITALLGALALVCAFGAVAAAPASAHSEFDVSVACGANYHYVVVKYTNTPGSQHALTIAVNTNTSPDTYCAVGFALESSSDHGVSHYMRVRIHSRSDGYGNYPDSNDVDAGYFSHYAGGVKEARPGAGDCIDADLYWIDPQTGSDYTQPQSLCF